MRRDVAEKLLVGESTATILCGNGCKTTATTVRFIGSGHMVKTAARVYKVYKP